MEKNENMNQDSLTSMKEFKKKNIQSNICIHKICILMLTIINITHIIFLIIYKIKLKKIKQKISLHRSIITPLETKIKRSNALANKKIVNVASQTKKCYFSFLFETIDEINTIKNLILSKKNIADETIKMQMIYQSRFDGDNLRNENKKQGKINSKNKNAFLRNNRYCYKGLTEKQIKLKKERHIQNSLDEFWNLNKSKLIKYGQTDRNDSITINQSESKKTKNKNTKPPFLT